MNLAPASGGPWAPRRHAPSGPVQERAWRSSRMRLCFWSWSSTAALRRAASSRSSPSDARSARPNRSSSQPGSASAASVMAACCSGDSVPVRAAASVLGCVRRRLALSSCCWALDTDSPLLRPSMWAGVRSPPMRHSSVSAIRAAASALSVAQMCSIRAARSITPSASDPERNAASKLAATVANDVSNSRSFVHMGTAFDGRLLNGGSEELQRCKTTSRV